MPRDIQCAACGERDAIRGERQGEEIVVTCQVCGHSGQRPPRYSCPTCGGTDMVPVRQELREKVRGTQIAVMGVHMVYRCQSCDT